MKLGKLEGSVSLSLGVSLHISKNVVVFPSTAHQGFLLRLSTSKLWCRQFKPAPGLDMDAQAECTLNLANGNPTGSHPALFSVGRAEDRFGFLSQT